jgi:hypothetical protein
VFSNEQRMSQPDEDIVVTKFTTTEADQDPEHKAVFKFQFMLSRSAPDLWVQIAKRDVSEGERANFCIQRHAWAYGDRIVVRCSAGEAQRIKDVLNTDILPNVNKEYRRLAAESMARKGEEDARQHAILSEVEKAIWDQK